MIADASLVPDLSHLSAEERAIIEEVFQRQRAEERKEGELAAKAEKELEEIDRQINERTENARRLVGTQDDAICQICQKTKFADGIGHKCFYCQLRSCARCGGRTTSKNKNIWACSLCQKRQSILAKTGKWIDLGKEKEPGTGQSSPTHSQTDSLGLQPLPGQPSSARGSIPNSISGTITNAANAMLNRRQSPPKIQPNHVQQNNIQAQSQNHVSSGPKNTPNLTQGQPTGPYPEPMRNGPIKDPQVYDPPYEQNRRMSQQQSTQQQQQQQQVKRQGTLTRQAEMETNGHHTKLNGAPPQLSSRPDYLPQDQLNSSRPQKSPRETTSPRKSSRSERDRDRERSYDRDRDKSYVEHDLHPGPRQKEYRDDREIRNYRDGRVSPRIDRRDDRDRREYRDEREKTRVHRKISDTRRNQEYKDSRMNRSFDYDDREDYPTDSDPAYRKNSSYEWDRRSYPDKYDRRSPSPRNGAGRTTRTGRKKDMTPNLQPAPPMIPPLEMPQAPPGHSPLALRQRKNKHNRHQTTSSSDDDVPSTSGEVKAEEFTEKDLLRYIYGSESIKSHKRGISDFGRSKITGELLPAEKPPSQVIPGDTLAAKIRNYLSNPVSWQPTADNRRLIGHMILSRNQSNNQDLGLKVVGGRHSGTRRLGAFITRVKPGSVADVVGQLRPGDEVLEWNGKSMQGISYQRVCDIINASKNDPRIELIVSRSLMTPGGDDFLNVQRSLPDPAVVMAATGAPPHGIYDDYGYAPIEHHAILPHSQSVMASQLNQLSQPIYGSPHKFSVPTMPMTADDPMLIQQQMYGSKTQIFGRIEISLLYMPHERELVITVHRATDLPPRPDGSLRNPYVKLFLLPDRSEKSRRQSAVLAETLSPYWNEIFYYRGLTEPALMSRILEVTVWDYDQYETNAFLGETLIDFSMAVLDNQIFSYTLVDMDDENPVRLRLRRRRYSSQSQGPPTRPYSEMGYRESGYHRHSGGYPIRPGVNDDYAIQYPQEGPINDYNIRRSRTYDRAGIYSNGASDWNINSSNNGYLSDNFSSQYKERRRPRSATAMRRIPESDQNGRSWQGRNIPQDIMEDAQYPQEAYPPQHQYPQQHSQHQGQALSVPPQGQPAGGGPPPGYIDPRTPNGRLRYEAMQEAQAGYGSDGSETLSVNSAQSMQNRVIRRHQASSEEGDGSSQSTRQQHMMNAEEDMIVDHADSGLGKPKSAKEHFKDFQEAKERKKSVLNKFIPGRGNQGDPKRTGFARSEEVGIPDSLLNPSDRLMKQVSKESTDSGHSDRYPVLPEAQLGGFVSNLGPGQVVGRQALASPILGEIQLNINFTNVSIDLHIYKAQKLVLRPGTRTNPAPYVKVYLMEGKNVVAKAKTQMANKTTAPIFDAQVHFDSSPRHKMLQITVLGDYGRMDKKAFIGIAQIKLDDIAPQMRPVNGWYKLFHSSSLTGLAPVRKDSETSLNEIK